MYRKITCVFNKNFRRPSFDSGFTLIELLVVVLIIGILSAVAVPQYQKAVEKARAAEAVTVMASLRKGVLAAQLANPGVKITEDMVDIAPAGDSWETKNFVYSLGGGDAIQACRRQGDNACSPGPVNLIKAWKGYYGNSLAESKICVYGTGGICPPPKAGHTPRIDTTATYAKSEYMLYMVGGVTVCGGNTDLGKEFCNTFNAAVIK